MSDYHIEAELVARKALNPTLPDDLRTRSGVSHGPPHGDLTLRWDGGEPMTVSDPRLAMCIWEVIIGWRAITHRLRQFDKTGL